MMDQDLQNPWNNDYQDPYQAEQPPTPAAPAAPATTTGANPTYGNGTQIGGGTAWAPGSSAPTGAPAGYTWDPNTATFQPTPGTAYTSAQAPINGNLVDPGYAGQLVSWAGNQSGVNPSVKNDPNYWISRFTSGAFGNDQNYAIQRMMQPEGAPEGAGGGAGGGVTGGNGASGQVGNGGSTYNYSYNGGSLAPPGVSDQLYKMLLDRTQQSLTVDSNDPNIRQQVDPAAAQIERDRRNYLANVAESRGPLANIKGETRVSEEKGAQMKAQLESGLIGKELQAKRDEITQALTELGSRLSSDQALGLQKELGYLNNALGKYGIDTSAGLQQQQINSGNDQFAQTFGANATNSANYWDAIRRGLI